VFEPVAENQQIYDRLYRQVYKRMYRQLQPLYRDIAEITGYPKVR
jgi:sugar (pentulose or hexulose) kinase